MSPSEVLAMFIDANSKVEQVLTIKNHLKSRTSSQVIFREDVIRDVVLDLDVIDFTNFESNRDRI